MESAGQIAAALDRLESVLVLEPASEEALAIQRRLLKVRSETAAEKARQAAVAALLGQASDRFGTGEVEEALEGQPTYFTIWMWYVLATRGENEAALDWLEETQPNSIWASFRKSARIPS